MSDHNKHGLSRDIRADVKRIVRRNSKFGCVLCRRGVYVYEHIDPTFEDAVTHDPDHICCLCATCHDAVTRKQLSKAMVVQAYERIRHCTAQEVGAPIGPLDFHTGTAVLEIGELHYAPAVRSVLVYNNIELFGVHPSSNQGEPGFINAVFTDEAGRVVATMSENGWEGATDVWDIEVVAGRLTVRRQAGEISLQLILRPPGIVVVDRLDMRFGNAHLLVASGTYVVGRYVTNSDVAWVHVDLKIHCSSPAGRVIEITTPDELQRRLDAFKDRGKWMSTPSGEVVLHSNAGVLVKPWGIVIGGLTGSFSLHSVALGTRPLAEMRRIIVSHPDKLDQFIATGVSS